MASNPKPFLDAAKRYGSDPEFDAWARETYHVSGPALLAKVAKGESNFDMGAVSSAGARGGTQFMPATRADFIKRFGVDPWASPDQAIHGTKLYLENHPDGLAGYNPGMPTYTNYILDQHVGDLNGRKVKAPKTAGGGGMVPTTTTTPGVDNSAARGQALYGFLSQGGVKNPNATLQLALAGPGLKDVPAQTTTTYSSSPSSRPSRSTGGSGSGRGGTVTFDGERVARWIGEALQYARSQGWKGTVTSGYRTDAQQKAIYDSGVRPAAKPRAYGGGGSNHEFTVYPGGAVDVSEAQQLSAILSRSKYRNRLVWAGAKDPVHFSKPHNGSY